MQIEQGFVLNLNANTDSHVPMFSEIEEITSANNSFANLLLPIENDSYSSESIEDKTNNNEAESVLAQLSAIHLISPQETTADKLDIQAPQNQCVELSDIVFSETKTPEIDIGTREKIAQLNESQNKLPISNNESAESFVNQLLVSAENTLDHPFEPLTNKSPEMPPGIIRLLAKKDEDYTNTQISQLIPEEIPVDEAINLIIKPKENHFHSISEKSPVEGEKKTIIKINNGVDLTVKPIMDNDFGELRFNDNSMNQEPNVNKGISLPEAEMKMQQTKASWNMSVEEEVLDKQVTDKITLHVNQEELGEITAKIQIVNKQSVVSFVTETTEAKSALIHHIEQLKDIFNESNLILNQTHIEQELQGDGQQRQEKNRHPSASGQSLKETNNIQPKKTTRKIDSVLDTFA